MTLPNFYISLRLMFGIALLFSLQPTLLSAADEGWSEEIEFGKLIDSRVISSGHLIQKRNVTSSLNSIALRLYSAGKNYCPKPHVRVLQSSKINAYASRGGFIYINSGLLDFVRNKDEIAGVIAHELAHNCMKHLLQRAKAQRRAAFLGQVGVSFLGGIAQGIANETNQPHFGPLGSVLSAGLVNALVEAELSGYHKEQELEADAFGLQLMLHSKFDPRQFIGLLNRLSQFERTLTINPESYGSALINKSPGLRARIDFLNSKL